MTTLALTMAMLRSKLLVCRLRASLAAWRAVRRFADWLSPPRTG
jgi:hypothetical protein